jgi:hypothetical protein
MSWNIWASGQEDDVAIMAQARAGARRAPAIWYKRARSSDPRPGSRRRPLKVAWQRSMTDIMPSVLSSMRGSSWMLSS